MEKRSVAGVFVLGLLLFCVLAAGGVNGMSVPSSVYSEGFEGAGDPVEIEGSPAEYTVNYKGVTGEKAFSGKQSYKIDITFNSGAYATFRIPVQIFSEGNLKFTARIYVDGKSSGSVKLGPGYGIIPDFPGYDGMNNLLADCGTPVDKWGLAEADVVEMGGALVKEKLPDMAWGVKEDNMGFYMNGVVLYLYPPAGGSGRMVVYLDEILVQGNTVSTEKYVAGVEKRWAPARALINEKLDAWDNTIAGQEKELSGLTAKTPQSKELKEDILEKIPHIKRRIITARSCGFIPPGQMEEMAGYFAEIQGIIDKIKSES